MKVFVNGKLYDSEEEPVVLVFENKSDLKNHLENLNNCPQPQDPEEKRVYYSQPDVADRYLAERIANILKTKNPPQDSEKLLYQWWRDLMDKMKSIA